MIMNEMKTNNGKRLLAAFLVIAMVACVFVAVPTDAADDSNATIALGTDSKVSLGINEGDLLDATVSGYNVTLSGNAMSEVYNGKDTTFNKYFKNVGGAWGYMCLNGIGAWAGDAAALQIVQTNSALKTAWTDPADDIDKDDGTKTKTYTTTSDFPSDDDTYYFLIPKDGSSVTIEIQKGTLDKDVFTASNEAALKITLNFANVSTQIQLGTSDISGDGYSYTNNTLTLDGYDGSESFYHAGDLAVTVKNENTIDAYCADNKAAISAGKSVTISGTGTLNITQNNDKAFGISASEVTISASEMSDKTTVNIDDGGNRAIYGWKSITIRNAYVDVAASEKAIRGGSVTITGSDVTATLIDAEPDVNSQGVDDRWGIKTSSNLSVTDSKVNTAGLRIDGSNSTVTISGTTVITVEETTQYSGAELDDFDADLYYENYTTLLTAYSEKPTAASKNGYILLDSGCTAYGNVQIMGATGDEPTSAPAAPTTVDELNDAMIDSSVSMVVINSSYTGNETVVEITKDVVITGNTTFNGTLTDNSVSVKVVSGVTYNGTINNANNSVVFTNAQGDFTVTYGSVEINGKITAGTFEVVNDVKITGSIDSDAESVTFNRGAGVTGMQKVTLGGDFSITDGNMTVGENVVLVVPEGVTLSIAAEGTLTVNGGLAIYGTIDNAGTSNITFGANGKYAVADGVVDPINNAAKKTSIYVYEDAFGVSNTVTGNTEWNTATYLTNDITIAEGVTVTIGDKGYLDLCGHDLIVKGTLVISGKAYITDSEYAVKSDNAIYI